MYDSLCYQPFLSCGFHFPPFPGQSGETGASKPIPFVARLGFALLLLCLVAVFFSPFTCKLVNVQWHCIRHLGVRPTISRCRLQWPPYKRPRAGAIAPRPGDILLFRSAMVQFPTAQAAHPVLGYTGEKKRIRFDTEGKRDGKPALWLHSRIHQGTA